MISRAKSNWPTEQIDFFGQRLTTSLPRIQTLQEDLEPIRKLVTLYSKVLDQNGSVAKHLHIPLFSSRVEDMVSGLFSTSQPLIVDVAGDGDCCGILPNWVDVIRESKTIDQVLSHNEERYRISVRGATVEVCKSDYDILSSNVLQMLLGTPAEAEDVQTELRARNELIDDLAALGEGISEVNVMIQSMLQALQEHPQTADRDSARSEPPASPAGMMCDIDETSNLSLGFEMVIDKDMDDDFCDSETRITPRSLEKLTTSTSKAPLKRGSTWSASEKRKYRDFLRTRGHLTWSQIALEYEAEFHKGRSPSSIAGQARCLGVFNGRKPGKRLARTARHDPLVLKVRVPHTDKLSSCEKATAAGLAHTSPTPCLEDPSLFPSSAPSNRRQDCYKPPAESHTIQSPDISDSLPPLPLSAKDNHINVRHSGRDVPRSFDLILN